MSELERMFIRKEYERKLIFENTQRRDAYLNAYINANRKKNSKFIDLYKKPNAKVDVEYNLKAETTIMEIEKRDGKSWVDKIYQAAGLKRK